ncbi:hypothetical protein C1646_723877, partial [Rhizophagus diaphanus]
MILYLFSSYFSQREGYKPVLTPNKLFHNDVSYLFSVKKIKLGRRKTFYLGLFWFIWDLFGIYLRFEIEQIEHNMLKCKITL